MGLPESILIADVADLGLCIGTAEELATLADGESVIAGRYRLVGAGVVHSYADYVEGNQPQCDDENGCG